MAAGKSIIIPPFPDTIDRDYFGAWLSGFADGEATFYLGIHSDHTIPLMMFRINLRSDDTDVLRLIQSYWQCGSIRKKVRNYSSPNANPTRGYAVRDGARNLKTIVDHFDKYPMFGKKQDHYRVWRAAADIVIAVKSRRQVYNLGRRGVKSKWRPGEFDQYLALRDEIKRVRTFSDGPMAPAVIPEFVESQHLPLFDRDSTTHR